MKKLPNKMITANYLQENQSSPSKKIDPASDQGSRNYCIPSGDYQSSTYLSRSADYSYHLNDDDYDQYHYQLSVPNSRVFNDMAPGNKRSSI